MKNIYATIFVDYADENGKSITTNYLIEKYEDDDPRKNYAYSTNKSPSRYYSRTLKQTVDAVLAEISQAIVDGYVESVYIKTFNDEIKQAIKEGGNR